MSLKDKIDNWFVYHPPKGDQTERYQKLREGARQYAHLIDECVPDGPDKSAAIRKLRECVHTANAGIACDE